MFFLLIVGSALFLKRAWCRGMCPLGALYALVARFALLKRTIVQCIGCKRCKSNCRTGAIMDDVTYAKGDCILCMDCLYDCPQHITRFQWVVPQQKGDQGMTRRSFLVFMLITSLPLLGFSKRQQRKRRGYQDDIIRPPAALGEDEFLDSCIRCGNCMKVCITNGLQPVLFQAGFAGIWTPHLVPEIGYCEYQCTLCGNVCPTGALPSLTVAEKQRIRLGAATVNHSLCLPWSRGQSCIVCEEHCPVPGKAIKLEKEIIGTNVLLKPYVDPSLCVGCGICQHKCPVRPERAIKVYPRGADRT